MLRKQFRDALALAENQGPPLGVVELLAGIDAERCKNGCCQVRWGIRIASGKSPVMIGGADKRAAADTAPRKEATLDRASMVATRHGADGERLYYQKKPPLRFEQDANTWRPFNFQKA